jgi:hypothetical protein
LPFGAEGLLRQTRRFPFIEVIFAEAWLQGADHAGTMTKAGRW